LSCSENLLSWSSFDWGFEIIFITVVEEIFFSRAALVAVMIGFEVNAELLKSPLSCTG
jgi:hypothetical protein